MIQLVCVCVRCYSKQEVRSCEVVLHGKKDGGARTKYTKMQFELTAVMLVTGVIMSTMVLVILIANENTKKGKGL